ncbi:M56 family metallopeptidase [Nocardioides sp.]|uniref:M56 family metallopeptidase n=1 Tax=Nocardioides sp. TaxID=35761 RepID=UPI003514EE49
MIAPSVLGLLALVLAGPVPVLLLRLPALRSTPRAAVVLWQSVALAAVLAALGAGVLLATDRGWRHRDELDALLVAGVALVVVLVVAARLLVHGHRIGTRLRLLRRRHRAQLDVVGTRSAPGVRLLDHDVPLAYCVPGDRPGQSRVVLTAGVLARLGADEVDAVLAHERAHLRARHDLVLEAFSVLHAAFPRGVRSAAALSEVRLLVEVLADRAAVRGRGREGRRDLGRALVGLAQARADDAGPPGVSGHPPGVLLGAADVDLVVRVRLLADERPHRLQAALALLAAAALLLLPTLAVVLPWARDLA